MVLGSREGAVAEQSARICRYPFFVKGFAGAVGPADEPRFFCL